MSRFVFNSPSLFASILYGLCSLLFSIMPAYAGENVQSFSTGLAVNSSEYHRTGTTIRMSGSATTSDIAICQRAGVDCRNFIPNNADTTIECIGLPQHPDQGGWQATAPTNCWQQLDVCFYAGTKNEICVGANGMTDQDAGISYQPYSNCTPASPADKEFCTINYDGSPVIEGNTGDDMFAIPRNASVFFEYQRMAPADVTAPDRLRYIKRDTAHAADVVNKSLMMPSGPLSGANAFKDFKQFLNSHPSFITVEPACYPAQIRACHQATVNPPSQDGVCGDANGQSHATAPTDTGTELCAKGTASAVTGSGPYSWTCAGLDGGATSPTCQTSAAACGTVDSYVVNYETGGMVSNDCVSHEHGGHLGLPYCRQSYSAAGEKVLHPSDLANGNCVVELGAVSPSTCSWADVTIVNGGSACP